jgi:protein phosphatase 1 regulatory subunit 7
MKGLKHLTHLKKIDLGANRIRVMDEEELSGLVNLEELWLGKNKIEEIQGLEKVRFESCFCVLSCSSGS